ncbi:MAG TPA: hypothetical protein VIF82_17325 [Burkholderiaceae bacterium]
MLEHFRLHIANAGQGTILSVLGALHSSLRNVADRFATSTPYSQHNLL